MALTNKPTHVHNAPLIEFKLSEVACCTCACIELSRTTKASSTMDAARKKRKLDENGGVEITVISDPTHNLHDNDFGSYHTSSSLVSFAKL